MEAFLDGRVSFPAIHQINLGTLDALAGRFAAPVSLGDLLELDARARSQAAALALQGQSA